MRSHSKFQARLAFTYLIQKYTVLCTMMSNQKSAPLSKPSSGVPVVAQWLTNLTRNHEVVVSIPGLVQWVKDPVLP